MDWTGDVFAVCLLAAGATLGIVAKKRRFDRTNEFGVQRFASFSRKLRGRTADYLLIGCSVSLVSVATIMLSSNHLETWGWVVLAPVCVSVLYLLVGT